MFIWLDKSITYEFSNFKNLSNAKTEEFYQSDPKNDVYSSYNDFVLNQNEIDDQKRKFFDNSKLNINY